MLDPLTGDAIKPNPSPDDEPLNAETAARTAGSDLLMAIASCLFLVFLANTVVELLPVQLLKPQWQLGFVARLLGSSSIALGGFAFVHIASTLNPANPFYRRRLETVRRLATFAAIGFFLLIPLQGFATWKSYTQSQTTQQALIEQSEKRLAPLKQAIESATGTADLQQKLSRLPEFRLRLGPDDLDKPLDQVRTALLNNIARTENLYADRLATKPNQIWAAIQGGTRTLLTALAYSFAFAAGAQPGRSSVTLLDMIRMSFQSLLGGRRRRSRPSA
ncbi:hypothetical protein [Synechococcus sp. CCY 9618]|uniref:hypothetical protein n=1 Tax=Synechococcus sp. CCY 9618 TaxID=2815602 RepID=UPI001C250576|nr:hypothetical protein [Synechococcus sp. CCY 9618]